MNATQSPAAAAAAEYFKMARWAERRVGPPQQAEEDFAAVIPPVTVVLEGRAICQRISLHKHGSYESLAKALRRMFVDDDDEGEESGERRLDLTNAVPGYIVAYEDIENDLLLAGDLNWKLVYTLFSL
ncbi:auxin-responsive protein IAA33 [Cucumis melo var. makuwa]|uniref:Auxin-responsive protein n=1 Tax=Cucumis melo var. makuwa TaxID=1194695 RepID=A0A5D3BTE4_CUCMM|nr:auxin-responsive protein IAA33 [Cucumis melo var. makuwa]